jgi:hypothetical protein
VSFILLSSDNLSKNTHAIRFAILPRHHTMQAQGCGFDAKNTKRSGSPGIIPYK